MQELKILKKHLACIRKENHISHLDCGTVVFQSQLLQWYEQYKRDDLPWRRTKKQHVPPYEIFISEIMLQQTQVLRVRDKFPKFISVFPTLHHLAKAPLATVLREWQGMGYNRRGLYLKQCAEEIIKKFDGDIPSDPLLLETLPGIGPYTSGAISCFAFNRPTVFLDTNIRKLFIYYFFTDCSAQQKISDKEIIPIAKRLLYKKNPRVWNYALMDYGALLLSGKSELLSRAKSYHKQSSFLGSNRFFRSQIVQYLLKRQHASFNELQKICPHDISPLLINLCKEGLIRESQPHVFVIYNM